MIDVQLTERQQAVLRLVIQEYINSAMPVSSKSITNDYNLRVSSATVRNEMAVLEEKGYLTHPHISAGRVPTEKGYRYFVQELMGRIDLPAEEQKMISRQFHQARLELDQWLRLSVAILAHISHNAALVTAPKTVTCCLEHLKLILIQEQIVLMIMVLRGGTVKQQLLTFEQTPNQDELEPVANRLTELWKGLDVHSVSVTIPSLINPVAIRVGEMIVETMRQFETQRNIDIYRDGLLNTLTQPEFKGRDGIEQIIRAIEERQVVEKLINEALRQGGVQIIIGGEGKWEELSDVSIVLARYGIDDKITGVMGVFGPLRMPYKRTVSVVRYVSDLMSSLVSDLYGYKP